MSNSLLRKLLALSFLLPASGLCQSAVVPGRDLLTFPIGLSGEPAALGTHAGAGLWNPGTLLLPGGSAWRVSAAAMTSSSEDLGVQAQLLAVTRAWRGNALDLSVVRASVGDLVRTDDNPLSIGDEIPYSTLLVSLGAARRLSSQVTGGLALRSRSGRADATSRTRVSMDVGLLAEHMGPRDVRLGVSTFLLPLPGGGNTERTSTQLAADLRLIGKDSLRAVRGGLAVSHTEGGASEQFVFASGHWDSWEARGGLVRSASYGSADVTLRLGMAFHYAGYTVSVAREGSANGFAPRFHFSLVSLLK